MTKQKLYAARTQTDVYAITEEMKEAARKRYNEQAFAEKVMFELEHNLGRNESGLSGFQELLDTAMIEVVESGEECVDCVETEW